MGYSKAGFPDLLTPGFKEIFSGQLIGYTQRNDVLSKLFNVGTSDKAYEKFSEIGAMGDLRRLDATGKVQYDMPKQGYDVTIDFPEYALGFTIPRKDFDDDLYQKLRQKPQDLALSTARTRQAYAAAVFNHAFDTSWTDSSGFVLACTGGDGQALSSDSHTFATGLTASTTPAAIVDNKGTTAISAAQLDTVRQAMRAFTDDRGNMLSINPDTILIPPELEKTMHEIGSSQNIPGEFSNTANFMYQRFQVIVWDLLTDANNWFMIDSQMMKRCLFWFDRTPAELGDAEDFDGVAAKWRVYARWGYGFTDWRWVYGSAV